MFTLTVVQHNVLHWQTRRHELNNMYRQYDPDVILLSSHGCTDIQNIKIYPYKVHQKNPTQAAADGVAIAVKPNIKHTVINNFTEGLIAVKIYTDQGPLILATIYLPPRRPYVPVADILSLLRHNIPIYLMGDFNARHQAFGYGDSGPVGRRLINLINRHNMKHIGPDFPTYITATCATTPDLVLGNHLAYHNIHLKQGDISTSDHLPIIARISSNPIQIPVQPRLNYNNANWEGFKEHLAQTPPTPPIPNDSSTHFIDLVTEQWFNDIQAATAANIPTINFKTLPYYKDNHLLKMLKIQYVALQEHAHRNGWNIDTTMSM